MSKNKDKPKRKDDKHQKAVAEIVPSVTSPDIDIGISTNDRRKIAQGLSRFLADAYTLYLKTHNYHWNVTGTMFTALHTMFEGQYTEQWQALDEIAERIRALGFAAPGSYADFARLSSIRDDADASEVPDWKTMVQQLVSGNEAVCRTARDVLKTADNAGDDPSVDMLTSRLQIHEKYAWMLRSLLE
ncbi:MAG: DNA starvation/stationary phase protection protein [Xanthomonadaceae bacterium]|jgi:starvation-inducible DNA-binding protein|nr:DNA starvation/stationary phase protection protein [Xanthomonadaceae bacterium]